MTTFAPTQDSELKDFVRAITQYSTSDIGSTDLDTQVKIAKMRIKNDVGSESWYSDEGLGQALTYTTCIVTKTSLENAYLDSWSVGDQSMTVRDATEEDSAQLQDWNEAILDGLEASSVTSDAQTFTLSSNYDF